LEKSTQAQLLFVQQLDESYTTLSTLSSNKRKIPNTGVLVVEDTDELANDDVDAKINEINTNQIDETTPKNAEEKDAEEKDDSSFATLCRRISSHLRKDQEELEKKCRNSKMYIVTPLHNVLFREINHAIEMRAKYMREKRYYDDICTTIENLKKNLRTIKQIEESGDKQNNGISTNQQKPAEQEQNEAQNAAQNKNNFTSRFKMTWARFAKSSASGNDSGVQVEEKENHAVSPENKSEYERKLKEAREKYKVCVKSFETTKQQLLECIELIANKLNLETEHYFKQFGDFVEKSRTVQSTL